MRKEPSTAEKMNGAFAPKLVDLTDRVRFERGLEASRPIKA